jgi:hypothetical protein
MYERAAGYNSATGSDDFTDMTQRKMASVAIPQYDAAGNPISAIQAQAPSPQAAPGTATQPAPAQSGPSDDDLISKFLGPSSAPANANVSPATGDRASELRAATGAPALTDDDLLAKYLGSPAPANSTADATTGPDATTKAPPAPTDTPAGVKGASDAFQQSTMNSIPVIGPLVDSAADFVGSHIASLITGKSPEEMQQAAQAREQQTAAANPVATTAGNVVGSVLPFALVGPESAAAKVLGTASDYGNGLIGNALTRTIAGAGSGAAISGADTLARGGTTQQAQNNALLGGAVGAVAPAALGIAGKALGGIKNAFLGPSAPKMLSNALVADQNAPEAVNALLQQRGPDATVADLGANTQGLAGGLASLPGKAQSIVVNNLKARAAQTGARLAQDVAGTIGQGQPIGALTDQIIAGQKAAAAPLYNAVRPMPVQMTPELSALAERPAVKSAFTQAATMMQNDGLAPAPNTVGFFDYAKQALDDQASAAVRNGENNLARQYTGMANDLRDAVDAQVPQYAQARAAFAGPAKVLDAVDMGQQIFSGKTSPEDLQSALAEMSPSEKDGLLAGAQAAVQKTIGNARTDAAGVKSLFDSANGKQKLAMLVGQDQADQIANALERERVYSGTSGKVINNSVTSANLAQQRILNPELAGVPKQMAPQSSIGLLISGLEKARSALTGAYRNAQNAHLANMLTGGPLSPADAAAVSRAATPPLNPFLAAAPAMPGIARETGVRVPGLGSFDQPDRVFRNGHWIPRIYVRGANPLTQ